MKNKCTIVVVDTPIDWVGMRQELKPVLTYIIGIVTGAAFATEPYWNL